MFETKNQIRAIIARQATGWGGVLIAGALLSGCSQVPDAVNPAEWYKSTVDFFAGEDEEQETATKATASTLAKDRGKAPQGDSKNFPKLSSVDQQSDYHEARKRGGLVADTEGRKYAPAIARQGEPSSRLAATPPAAPQQITSAAAQPAPAAQPASPVSIAGSSTQAASLPSTSEQKAFQSRLQSRLNEIRARAGQPPVDLPTSVGNPLAQDDFGTVVVSSVGVSSGYGSGVSAAAPVTAVMANASPLTHIARPARPLTAGAVKVATINFSNGSASLSSRDRQIIANAHQLQKERGGKIHIVGHASSRTNSTDPVRHKMVNFKVSVDRADAIARELIRLGVKKEEMVVDAISDANPLYFEFMPTGEAGNRRAEIYLES
ncbi:MAG: OmpA family protein [Rhodospirillaceae bacterium]|nr:OmpA family protein [Rhodospirillaceae bacterium]